MFVIKRGTYSKVNYPCFPVKRGIKSEQKSMQRGVKIICVHIYDPEKRQCRKWQATVNGTPHMNKVHVGTASAYVVALKVARHFPDPNFARS